jgi:hypothetical protein
MGVDLFSIPPSKPPHGPAASARWTGFSAPVRPGCGKLSAVPRPRPLRSLIDGRPDDSGRAVARRAMLLLIPAVLAANVMGAIVARPQRGNGPRHAGVS